MKRVTEAAAKAALPALLACVEAGETVLITRRHKVVAEVRPAEGSARKKPRPIGLCKGEFVAPPDFDVPLADEHLG